MIFTGDTKASDPSNDPFTFIVVYFTNLVITLKM